MLGNNHCLDKHLTSLGGTMTSEELMPGILVDHEGGVSRPIRSAVCLLNSPMGNRNGSGTGKSRDSKQFPRISVRPFHPWYPVHCRDSSKPFNIPSGDGHRVGLRSLPGVDARYEYSPTSPCRSRLGGREMASNTDQILPDGVIGIFRPRGLM
jgi:hypothetical protein